jgi:hypothetical protein
MATTIMGDLEVAFGEIPTLTNTVLFESTSRVIIKSSELRLAKLVSQDVKKVIAQRKLIVVVLSKIVPTIAEQHDPMVDAFRQSKTSFDIEVGRTTLSIRKLPCAPYSDDPVMYVFTAVSGSLSAEGEWTRVSEILRAFIAKNQLK